LRVNSVGLKKKLHFQNKTLRWQCVNHVVVVRAFGSCINITNLLMCRRLSFATETRKNSMKLY